MLLPLLLPPLDRVAWLPRLAHRGGGRKWGELPHYPRLPACALWWHILLESPSMSLRNGPLGWLLLTNTLNDHTSKELVVVIVYCSSSQAVVQLIFVCHDHILCPLLFSYWFFLPPNRFAEDYTLFTSLFWTAIIWKSVIGLKTCMLFKFPLYIQPHICIISW